MGWKVIGGGWMPILLVGGMEGYRWWLDAYLAGGWVEMEGYRWWLDASLAGGWVVMEGYRWRESIVGCLSCWWMGWKVIGGGWMPILLVGGMEGYRWWLDAYLAGGWVEMGGVRACYLAGGWVVMEGYRWCGSMVGCLSCRWMG